MKTYLAEIWQDYISNFRSVSEFARHYDLPFAHALQLLTIARDCYRTTQPE